MNRFLKKLTVLVCTLMLACTCGCDSNDKRNINPLILDKVKETVPSVSDVSVVYSQIADIGVCYHFTAMGEKLWYEGVAICKDDEFLMYDLAQQDLSNDFSVHMALGELLIDTNKTIDFLSCSGMVYNDKIEAVRIFLSNNTAYEVHIGKNLSYCIFVFEKVGGLTKIEGLNQEGNVISTYPYR